MARNRGPGLVGLLWSVLGIVLILSVVDLSRGRDSTLRSWWSVFHFTKRQGSDLILDDFRKNPGAHRPR